MKTVLFIMLSSVVFIGEFQMFIQYEPLKDFLLNILYEGGIHVYALFFIFTVVFGYMIFVCSYTIFSVKIFGFYGFYERNTDSVTFLTFIYYLAKLTYPLCYTTLHVLLGKEMGGKTKRKDSTAFFDVIPMIIIEYW